MNPVTVSPGASLAGKYLTVAIGRELFGLGILRVREIIRLQRITLIPGLPAELKGVINLRGRVIPVVDLRLKFGVDAAFAERTCIVVVEAGATTGRGSQLFGAIVDRVEEVITLEAAQIEATALPSLGGAQSFLLGLGKTREHVVLLLDLARLVAPADLAALPSAA